LGSSFGSWAIGAFLALKPVSEPKERTGKRVLGIFRKVRPLWQFEILFRVGERRVNWETSSVFLASSSWANTVSRGHITLVLSLKEYNHENFDINMKIVLWSAGQFMGRTQ
jgi:hypothetical protein